MGLKNVYFSAIDYMLETMSLVYYLLIIVLFNLIIDVWKKNNTFTVISENNNNTDIINNNYTDIQSAENCKGFSETIRQLSNKKLESDRFFDWLAGVVDGDGNFDIRKVNGRFVLKAIRIKLHNRDIRILVRILGYLHMGRIRSDKNKPHSIYIVSTKAEMKYMLSKLNGKIRIKIQGLKSSCEHFNMNYIEANYLIEPDNAYLSGLVDTDGSIVYNYSGNRIECNLEMKENEYSRKLNLSKVIPNCEPYIIHRTHKNSNKTYYSIAFKYQNVQNMIFVYEYFMKNRLYSDFKFYRVSKIKPFLIIRDFKNSNYEFEYKKYKQFMLDFLKNKNTNWNRLSYIDKFR